MNSYTVQSGQKSGTYIRLRIPLGDPDAFRYRAIADILQLLADNPDQAFTNRALHRVTGRGLSGVNAAVDTLDALGVVTVDRSGRANAVRIDPEVLCKPDDPVTAIPQSDFHAPVRRLLSELDDRIDDDIGVVLFGSVARGTADRTSDIDLFVVVEDNRLQAQRAAHTIEQAIAEQRFDGERYEAHIIVESIRTAATHDRIDEILVEGITLRESEPLAAVKRAVFDNGAG